MKKHSTVIVFMMENFFVIINCLIKKLSQAIDYTQWIPPCLMKQCSANPSRGPSKTQRVYLAGLRTN